MNRLIWMMILGVSAVSAQRDPGPRAVTAPPQNGALAGLTSAQWTNFQRGHDAFTEVDGVEEGLGPRFNGDGCASCHTHPFVGGSSPATNPQIAMATRLGALNRIPPFLQLDGPIKVVRFQRGPNGQPDGGVHNLFVITGRADAPAGCKIEQPDFANRNNLSFRIPTPVFGLGLIEALSDRTLEMNLAANTERKRQLGIQGKFNHSGNDGSIMRFGWKAQNTLGVFSGEAYNVEVGVTNDLFPHERETDPACQSTASPESKSDLEAGTRSDIELFTLFMRFMAPPRPAPPTESTRRGRDLFEQTGCTMCHTPSLRTSQSSTEALSDRNVELYSDLALHRMGQNLADGITQGEALPADWRTAPLWGLGSRLFFLHDGRTKDLQEAIRQHAGQGSEANTVVRNYDALTPEQRQDLLDFLRSL